MIKVVILDQKRAELSHEEFRTYWLEEHAPLARELPGLRKYTVSLPASPADHPYQGIAELWFDDTEAATQAFDTDIGQEVQADAEMFVDPETKVIMHTEEHTIVDDLA